VYIKWIASFLSERSQRVILRGKLSEAVAVTSGVPQGSVLGPSLFLIYINDIINETKHSTIRLFADDTIIYQPIKSMKDCLNFQEDLDNLHRWSSRNLMKFKAKKVTLFKSEQFKYHYNLNGVMLDYSPCIKYLGITI